ncbi:hypothetical protein C8J57DRAFT_1568061 [Mycena rebaudengoi]|nr:hypothetical protein C8J57DRAFT_1568061 [Mycena rebaudengoi]
MNFNFGGKQNDLRLRHEKNLLYIAGKGVISPRDTLSLPSRPPPKCPFLYVRYVDLRPWLCHKQNLARHAAAYALRGDARMLTVLGVVIGLAISYRTSTSYDRYWTGRMAWSDVIRNTRSLRRMIWHHTPLRLSSRLPEEPIGARRSEAEMKRAIHEKKMALDLVEGFAVALKNHLRNKQGIYYEDLYDLIRPLHDSQAHTGLLPLQRLPSAQPPKRPANPSSVSATMPQFLALSGPTTAGATNAAFSSTVLQISEKPSLVSLVDAHTPLLPASNPGPEGSAPFRRVVPDIIPFAGLFASLQRAFRSNSTAPDAPADATGEERDHRRTWRGPVHPEKDARWRWKAARERNALNARVARLVYEAHDLDALDEPRRDNQPDDEAGENLPAEILKCLSEWVALLDERGPAPSTTISSIIAGIQALEISLTNPTSPHDAAPLVSVGAFVYLGFVAAGEEIKQPFGYDDNDLDLDPTHRFALRMEIITLH